MSVHKLCSILKRNPRLMFNLKDKYNYKTKGIPTRSGYKLIYKIPPELEWRELMPNMQEWNDWLNEAKQANVTQRRKPRNNQTAGNQQMETDSSVSQRTPFDQGIPASALATAILAAAPPGSALTEDQSSKSQGETQDRQVSNPFITPPFQSDTAKDIVADIYKKPPPNKKSRQSEPLLTKNPELKSLFAQELAYCGGKNLYSTVKQIADCKHPTWEPSRLNHDTNKREYWLILYSPEINFIHSFLHFNFII